MSMSYMWEVLYTGTRGLASGRGVIQERLENTFTYLAGRLRGPNTNLPPELADRARDIVRRGTCVAAVAGEGTIAATCRSMGDEEASALAQDIVDLYDEVCRLKAVEDHATDPKRN
jgi:hypothetical protein